ncbi:MAG: choice-of-anchor L domain-containing protein [Nitrosomonas sp.]|nr:choice-of-anchor L domain-containing protein [Nitrosomonas sp.]MDP1951415.1 choice-of-anchor L domain-containing protein [Nitrosomonas sp.]
MPAFTLFDSSTHATSSLTSALLSATSGIAVDTASIQLKYGTASVSNFDPITFDSTTTNTVSIAFYDGSIPSLGIGAGLLLTSGDGNPPASNTQSGYGAPLTPSETDSDLNASVLAAFPSAGEVQDATVLQFQFFVSDPTLQNIRFDLVFGSDEYPEFSDSSFVDIGGVYVNGTNYALFNNQISQPLSILSSNLQAGNFRDNVSGTIPLEYDGISHVLSIIAPVHTGTNTMKIAIADTGDQILDSGLFIGNVQAINFSGSGLALNTVGTASDDSIQGKDFNEIFDLGNGNDIVNGGKGDDVLNGGNGFDAALFSGILSQYSLTNAASGYTILGPDGNDTLVDIEFALFGNDLFALDTKAGGMTYNTYALLQAAFNAAPSTDLLSEWVKKEMTITDLSTLAQNMIDLYAPGISNQILVPYLYQSVAGFVPPQAEVDALIAQIGPGKTFATQGDLFAFAALHPLNTAEITSIIGAPLALDLSHFV